MFVIFLSVFEVRDCTFKDVDVWVDILGHCLEDEHVCEKCGEFALKFHVVVSYNV